MEPEADAEPLEACTVDGKTVRASCDADWGMSHTYIISARLINGLVNGLVVGQTAMPDTSNALTAIRQRLPKRERENRVVSINVLDCQTDIAQTIVERKGWYLLAVKDNQSDLHAHRQRDFAYLDRTDAMALDRSETVERGRIERRTGTLMDGAHGLRDELDPDRRGTALGYAVRVVAPRTVRGRTARSVRDYITQLPVTLGPTRVADLVRGH